MRFFLFVFLLSASFTSLQAQQLPQPLISGEFRQMSVAQFAQQVEAVTPYRFYFNPLQFDSVVVDVSVKEQPIEKVLQLVFRPYSDCYFAVDAQYHVFLTRGIAIQTALPQGWPGNGSKPAATTKAEGNTAAALETERRRNVAESSENKLHEIGVKTNTLKEGQTTLSGFVRNSKTGEPVVNAVIFNEAQTISAATDQHGYYTIVLPAGRHTLQVQGLGVQDTRVQVMMYGDGKLDLEIGDKVVSLREVVVSSQKLVNINRVQQGVEKLSIQTIKQVPVVFGEADVLKVVLTLPGVKTVGEASTGFNVRGGSADQNLILFNGATIYNPSHFFGMFSAFNPEVVKDIELYKSSIPARYGGRLSSVLDINSREGNKKEFTGSAGIGLLTSRFNIEGPLKKDKASFILGARSTYANWLLGLLPDEYNNSRASFYDVNLGITHQINSKNSLYFTGYLSSDRFKLNSDTLFGYSNKNVSVKWKHTFANKLNATFTAGGDHYNYKVASENNKVNAYELKFNINQFNGRADFNYVLNSKHTFDFGLNSIRYKLNPGTLSPVGTASLVAKEVIPAEHALESAVYVSDRFSVNQQLQIEAGIRYSLFQYLGPQAVSLYAAGLPKEEANIIETRLYRKGKVIRSYHNPEYRLSARYAFTPSFSMKAGYNSSVQYIHMLSNTTAIAPTDVWKLSDANIRPQQGSQVSLGFYKNLKNNSIETSVEVYYKKISDYLDYKPGATLVMNHNIETDVANTNGKAYGIETMIKKQSGKLNGWVSYTYSRILLQMADPTIAEPVNRGEYYPANYDKPHDVTLVGNFKVNHRFSISLNATYSTGRPITLPVARYYYGGAQRVLYSDRNAHRIPDYFRTDFSMNIEGNHKVHQKTHNSWTIGLYNITGRRNPYSVYFITENELIKGYRLSIFGSIIPFVNFNIRF